MKYLLIVLFFFSPLFALEEDSSSKKLKNISLSLLWLDQFQFAGYYIAKEKGFYEDVGFNLEIKPMQVSYKTRENVIKQKTTYAIGRSSLILYDSAGEKIALLLAAFQSSPNILLSLKSSNIKTVKDLKGKSIMQTTDLLESVSLEAMLKSQDLSLNDIIVVPHSYNLYDLINNKVDVYAAYITNEPYVLEEQGIEYNYLYPKEEGFDFYSDILYTSREYADEHPQEVRKFIAATIKGWEYAFSHMEESVDLIYKKYNTQHKSKEALLYEAKELKKLAYYNNSPFGDLNENRIQRIYDIYKILGVSTTALNLERLLFKKAPLQFTAQERAYLKKKHYINYCTQPDSLPYSAIENGNIVGIGAGILELIEESSPIKFHLIETESWKESVQNIFKHKCDILPIAVDAPSRRKFLNFTDPYYHEPLVIVTKKEENYILSVESVLDKKFAILKGNAFNENLKANYPNLHLTEVESIEEGYAGVESGEYYGYIDIMISTAYRLQKDSKINLKIAGQFEQSVDVSIAIRKDDAMLYGIMNKVAKHISHDQLQPVLNRWVSINYTKTESIPYLKEVLLLIVVFIFLMLYKSYILKRKNSELELLQKKLFYVNKQLENRAYEITKELEEAQSIAKLGSWTFNRLSGTLNWSKETYNIFEVEPSSGENLYAIYKKHIHPEDRVRVEDEYRNFLEKNEDYNIEHRILMKDGRIKYVKGRAKTKYSDSLKSLVSYGTIQDITQSVLKEQEIKKKDMYLLHQSRLAQMGEMLSMIAHQWKQPLSAISAIDITLKTTIELERYNLSDKKEREDFLIFLDERLDKIALYVQNLAKTIRDFSDFYKPNKKSVLLNVDKVIMKGHNLLNDTLRAFDIQTSFDLHANAYVKIHENEFMQVILNIVNNAKEQLIEKRVENPQISIASYVDEESVYIEIEDNAGGIPKEILEKVFDPYFSTKSEKNGTGLGLYMCKMIVSEYHQGSISVENSSRGALFRIKIKREKDAV